MNAITTITFFRFQTASNRYWATKMMQLARPGLKRTEGLTWFRLLGTGSGNGFWFIPEFKIFALLAVWENENYADNFFAHAKLFQEYNEKASEIRTVYMKPLQSKGSWGDVNPFEGNIGNNESPIAVITRATIRFPALFNFWRHVPAASRRVVQSPGLIFSAGIGEWPLIQMATFSIWENEKAMKSYAYKSPEHLTAIKKAREQNWFREELFARFDPYRTAGEWKGFSDFLT